MSDDPNLYRVRSILRYFVVAPDRDGADWLARQGIQDELHLSLPPTLVERISHLAELPDAFHHVLPAGEMGRITAAEHARRAEAQGDWGARKPRPPLPGGAPIAPSSRSTVRL